MHIQLNELPNLEDVIDRSPLMVTPTVPVLDVMAKMSQPASPSTETAGPKGKHCALIVEENRLLGIFTEQDIVRLVTRKAACSALTIGEVMTAPVITFPDKPQETILPVLALLRQHRMRHLPIVDDQVRVVGIVTHESIRWALQPANLLKLRRASEVMTAPVQHLPVTASVLEVAELMAHHRISSVVIVAAEPPSQRSVRMNDEWQTPCQPLGIITERDIAQFQLDQLDFAQTQAHMVMSQPLLYAHPTDSLWEINQQMQQHSVRRLVITGAQDELLGIITQTNFLNILDPLEVSAILATLQQQVDEQLDELNSVNQQLHQARNKLEQRVQERTSDLHRANAQLQRANAQLQAEVSEHERTAASLRESERRYATLAAAAPVGIFRTDVQEHYLYVNEQWCNIVGLTAAAALGKGWIKGIHPDDCDRILAEWDQAVREDRPFKAEYRFQTAAGATTWVYGQAVAEFDQQGQIVGYVGTITDISDHKQAEQKIQEQAALIDTATDAIFVRDLEHRITFWSQGAERMYGWRTAETLGKSVFALLFAESPPEYDTAVSVVLETGKWQGEFQHLTQTGNQIIAESRWTLVCDPTGRPQSILTVNTDITEKKKLETQFLRAQRLDSIGTLASGIAHDLNNIFTPILAATELLPLQYPDLDERSQNLLSMLEDSSKRGAKLVKQILAFARGTDNHQRVPLQVRHILSEVVQVARQTFPKDVYVSLALSTTDLWPVRADATQLHQVFMNLCVNARDAMPDGGQLTITADNQIIDETYAQMHLDAHPGSYLVVTVEDSGKGMAPELIDQIFEPFFTTKEPGKGTGLGLSTVMSIVKSHNGFVSVYSEVGNGTRFGVFLPAVQAPDTATEKSLQKLPSGQGEMILVVDDEPSLRQIAQASLESHGYQTLLARDGIEAIALYAEKKDKIRAVLMDLMMPSMDGMTATRTLQKIDPQVKVIATSGLATNQVLAEMSGIGVKAFLTKPYTARELLETLRDVL